MAHMSPGNTILQLDKRRTIHAVFFVTEGAISGLCRGSTGVLCGHCIQILVWHTWPRVSFYIEGSWVCTLVLDLGSRVLYFRIPTPWVLPPLSNTLTVYNRGPIKGYM